MYTDLYTRNQRPPWHPILGAIAILSVIGAVFVYTTKYSGSTRASTDATLTHEIVNVSAKQVSVFWETDEPEQGWVLYGNSPDKLEAVGVDDRDNADMREKYNLHLVTLKNLDPNKEFYYKIVSGNTIYTGKENQPFSFKTPNVVQASSFSKPAYGKVAFTSGKPVENAIVKVYFENAVPLFTVTKATGEWLVPLQYVYSKKLDSTIKIVDETIFTIYVNGEDKTQSKISTYLGKSSPLPQTIVLGTNYDFNKDNENVLPAFTTRSSTPVEEVDIIFPKQEAVIPGLQPLLKGRGVPNSRIQLELNSRPSYRFNVKVNERGDWVVNVPRPLLPGAYMLTLYGKNSSNEDIVIVRSFTLAKSGEQVLAEATGPASLSPTQAISPSPLPTVEPSITVEPSPTVSIMPSISPTKSLKPSQVSTASATIAPTYIAGTPAPPVTGGNGLLYTVISVGLLVIGGGVMILL